MTKNGNVYIIQAINVFVLSSSASSKFCSSRRPTTFGMSIAKFASSFTMGPGWFCWLCKIELRSEEGSTGSGCCGCGCGCEGCVEYAADESVVD